MKSDMMAAALRGVLTRGAHRWDAAHCVGLPSLEGVADTAELLARLEIMEPRSEARDALLADLLRLHRRDRNGAALSAVLYAVHAGVVRRCARLVRALEPREGAARIACALLVSLDRFDPDRRSRHVEYSVCQDTWHCLWRLRCDEQRQRQLQPRLAALVGDACADLEGNAEVLGDLLGSSSGRRANVAEAEEVAHAEALAETLAAKGLLTLRDAQLLCRTALQRRGIPDVAQELGMKEAAAKKALQRAKDRLRARGTRVRSILLSLSSRDETF